MESAGRETCAAGLAVAVGALITFDMIDRLTQGRGDVWFEPIRNACADEPDGWNINTEHRVAMFLAETLQESNRYKELVENLRYSAAGLMRTFGVHYFPGGIDEAAQFEYNEYAIAERVYGGRMGNGPEGSGEGYKYRGRCPIQQTGKRNYIAAGAELGYDLAADPNRLLDPEWGAFAAARWWDRNGCNAAADDDDFEGVTRIIQLGNRHSTGRINGMPERLALLGEVAEAMNA